jgi:hypothetical protein
MASLVVNRLYYGYAVAGFLGAVMSVIGFCIHVDWLTHAAAIVFGGAIELLIVPLFAMAIRHQGNVISGTRLVAARVLLTLIVGVALCAIGYFQYKTFRIMLTNQSKEYKNGNP